MSLVILLALLSSVFYGASDFLGALSSRKMPVITASVAIYCAATVTSLVAFLFVPSVWSVTAIWSGTIAAVFAVVGMVSFYAALAIGPMSLLAPLIALIQTSVPVTVAALTGRNLSLVGWIAVGIALTATTLISVSTGATLQRISPRGAVLALISGVTLGLTVVSLDFAPASSGVIPAFLDITVGLVLLLPLIALRRFRRSDAWMIWNTDAALTPLQVSARAWGLTALGGTLLGVGNVLLVVALHSGNLAVVAVLMSLYPLATVLLAWIVLKERIGLVQFFGVLLAIAAAIMLSLN
ncbi:MAG: DMT family transporter [Terrimesophilobacter sp.]